MGWQDRIRPGTRPAGTPNTGTPNTGTPDTGTPDTGTPDGRSAQPHGNQRDLCRGFREATGDAAPQRPPPGAAGTRRRRPRPDRPAAAQTRLRREIGRAHV